MKSSSPASPKCIIAAHVEAITAPDRLPGIAGQAYIPPCQSGATKNYTQQTNVNACLSLLLELR